MKILSCLFLSLILCLSFESEATFQIKNQGELTSTPTSSKILDSESYRGYLILVNKCSVEVAVKLGSAHSANEGIKIPANGYWEPTEVPLDSIYAKSSTNCAIDYLEGVK